MKKLHVKLIMALGATWMLTSILISFHMRTWWGFMTFYGAFTPMGVGFTYWAPIICACEWFPERKGLINGIMIGSFGFAAFIFNFLTSFITNPNNLHPNIKV